MCLGDISLWLQGFVVSKLLKVRGHERQSPQKWRDLAHVGALSACVFCDEIRRYQATGSSFCLTNPHHLKSSLKCGEAVYRVFMEKQIRRVYMRCCEQTDITTMDTSTSDTSDSQAKDNMDTLSFNLHANIMDLPNLR